MKFRELVILLENRLGNHQLPANPKAAGLKDLLDGVPLHPDLVRRLLRAIYDENGCRSLDDVVTRHATLDALGPIRLDVLRAPSTDVDVYRLMDDFCTTTAAAFSGMPAERVTPAEAEREPAKVIPFRLFRRRHG